MLYSITTPGWTYPPSNNFPLIWPVVGMAITFAIIISISIVIIKSRKKPNMQKKLIAGSSLALVSLALLAICAGIYIGNRKTAADQTTFVKINFATWIGQQGYHLDSPQLNILYNTKKVQYDSEVLTLKLDTSSNTYFIKESK
jgi:apolipoprotein N-acyltransferase